MQKFSKHPISSTDHHISRVNWQEDVTNMALATLTTSGANVVGTSRSDRITLIDAVNGQTTTLGDDTIESLSGADYIDSSTGNDQITAGAGNDVVFAGEGNDIVRLGNGNDCVDAGDGDDRIFGGDGDDLESYYDDSTGLVMGGLNGGRGNDLIDGGAGDDVLSGDQGQDTLLGGAGADNLVGSEDGGDGDLLDGGADSDRLVGGASDTAIGGDGNDIIEFSRGYFDAQGPIFLNGGLGDDTLSAYDFSSIAEMSGGDGDDLLNVLSSSGNVDAGAGNDTIVISNTLIGGNSLRISTGAGADLVKLISQSGPPKLIQVADFKAGAGGDSVDISPLLTQISNYDLSQPFTGGWFRLVDREGGAVLERNQGTPSQPVWFGLLQFEGLEATDITADNFSYGYSPLGDYVARDLQGDESDDTLSGADGQDTVKGGLGSDQLDGGFGGDDVLDGEDGDDLLFGLQGNDTLLGGNGNDAISGGAGDDQIFGGEGNDGNTGSGKPLGINLSASGLDGGAGNDWIDGGAGDDRLFGGNGRDTLLGGSGNDFIVGDAWDDTTIGLSEDHLEGGVGNDNLMGETGDSLWGGDGDDRLEGEGATLLDGGAGNDQLEVYLYRQLAFEQQVSIIGGIGNDQLITRPHFYDTDVQADLGEGNDKATLSSVKGWSVDMGSGDDVLVVSGTRVTANLGEGNDTVSVQAFAYDTSPTQAIVSTGNGADTITPSMAGLYDYQIPRRELRVLDFDLAQDRIDLAAINGKLGLSAEADPFAAGLARLSTDGEGCRLETRRTSLETTWNSVLCLDGIKASDLQPVHFAQACTPVLSGNAAPSVERDKTSSAEEGQVMALNIASPTDPDGGALMIKVDQLNLSYGTLRTGDGRYIYYTGTVLTAAELASLQWHPNNDNVSGVVGEFSYSVTDSQGSVVRSSVKLVATPTPDAPIWSGNPSNSYADSEWAPVSINLSNFVSDPDGSKDLVYTARMADGSSLPTWLTLNAATGLLTGTASYGQRDTLDLIVTATDGTGRGTEQALTLTPAYSTNLNGTHNDDVILGSSGHDLIEGGLGQDTLNGRAGDDVLYGNLGDDVYIVGEGTDRIEEYADEGVDVVWSSTSFVLSEHLENIVLQGALQAEATGNESANQISGNSAHNRLSGLNGNDTLRGQDGQDELRGGAGSDWFIFEASAALNGKDSLLDLSGGFGQDVVDVSAFFGPQGGSVLDGDTRGGDAFDPFTSPAKIVGQHVLAIEDALGGAIPDGGDLESLLKGFTFSNGLRQVIALHDTDTGDAFLFFAQDRQNDGNRTLQGEELQLVASINFDGVSSFKSLDAANFYTQIPSQVSSGSGEQIAMHDCYAWRRVHDPESNMSVMMY